MVAVKDNALQLLTAAALALPGMAPESRAALPAEKPVFDLQYAHYQENNDRVSVDVVQGLAILPFEQQAQLNANLEFDTFSGATPVLTMPASAAIVVSGASGISGVDTNRTVTQGAEPIQVMTGASPYDDRYAFGFGGSYYLDDLTMHASVSRSQERDYLSYAYTLGMDYELNRKLTTLSFSFGQNFDQVEPTTRTLKESRTDALLQFGFSQVLDKKSLLKVSFSYSLNTGYLSNPYKKVYIQGLPASAGLAPGGFDKIFYENRPERRHRGAVSIGYSHLFSEWDGAVHLNYRYYRDSWGIDSHTFEVTWNQTLGADWMLSPGIRYYSQSKARFYELFYTQARSDNYYSSDYRLAGFGSLGAGVKLGKEILQNTGFISSVRLQAAFEYTVHAAHLKLGNLQGSSLTDFNYFLAMATLRIEF